MVGALEDRWVEEVLPVVAGAFIEEIDPDGFSGAALTFEGLFRVGVADEKVSQVLPIN